MILHFLFSDTNVTKALVGMSVVAGFILGILSYSLQRDNIDMYRQEIDLIKRAQIQDSVHKNYDSYNQQIERLEKKVDSLLKYTPTKNEKKN